VNPLKVITIKSSVSGLGWKTEYIPRLKELVSTTNTLVAHTFALTKFIFINELDKNESFNLKKYSQKDFYVQVFISLIKQQNSSRVKTSKTREFRELIGKHMKEYCQLSGYSPITLKDSQQIAAYECTKIDTASKLLLHYNSAVDFVCSSTN
jgi:hypothetical protein